MSSPTVEFGIDGTIINELGDYKGRVALRSITKSDILEKLKFLKSSVTCEILNKYNLEYRLSDPWNSVIELKNILSDNPKRELSTEILTIHPYCVKKFVLAGVANEETVFVNGQEFSVSNGQAVIPKETLVPGENIIKASASSKLLSIINEDKKIKTLFNPTLYQWELYSETGRNSWNKIKDFKKESKFDHGLNNSNEHPTLQFLQNSVKLSNFGPYKDIPHPVYDRDLECYRGHYWFWSTAPVVEVLYKYNNTALAYNSAKAYTRFIKDNPDDIQGIGIRARADIYDNEDSGFRTYIPPNDSAYIAQRAWLSSYRHNTDNELLSKSISVAKMIEESYERKGFLSVYYDLTNKKWADRTYVDAFFTTSFLKELYEVTDNEKWRTLALEITDDLLRRLKRKDYFIMNTGDNNNRSKKQVFVRGQGWALDGLISAYELGDNDYLEHAIQIANKLKRNQKDGWGYFLSETKTTDITTTALIAYYLKELDIKLEGINYNKTIKEATRVCEDSIVTNSCTRGAYGGLFCRSHGSGLVRKNYADSATALGASYYMLLKNKLDNNE